MNREKKRDLWIYGSILVVFIILLVFLTVKFAPQVTHLIKKPDRFRSLLTSYGPVSVFVFIFFQFIQVIIAAIPGELVQLAGGFVYGTFWGTVYSMVGILLGSFCAFFIARLVGYKVVKLLVSPKDLEKFDFLIESPKSEIIMFLLFLIPGIPKDILVYIAGFTPIKPAKFFTVFTAARFPSMLVASFIGANIQERDYLPVIVVSVIACICFVIGYLYKEKIIERLHRILHGGDQS